MVGIRTQGSTEDMAGIVSCQVFCPEQSNGGSCRRRLGDQAGVLVDVCIKFSDTVPGMFHYCSHSVVHNFLKWKKMKFIDSCYTSVSNYTGIDGATS
mmetsp:Transcript_1199/g.2631  ORF Transcript_1199/g.2631 Transcript_1199/m.2631 type:complete len:97 (-) Transcript_1199:162-452(-)